MTKQEAINLLEGLCKSLDSYCGLNEDAKNAFNMAIEALEVFDNSEQLPPVQPVFVLTCDGCRHIGTYDTDFPCSGCVRREKDYYEPEEG